MNTVTPLEKAFHLCGGPHGLAEVCLVTRPAVLRWRKRGRLPRTEWTGETHYAEAIEAATNGAVTKTELLSYVPPKP